jgi:aryl sulfotransferase
MSAIVWLASYPKSGNTWLRVVFANLLRSDGTPASINRLYRGGLAHAAMRHTFDDLVGYEASDLTDDEIDLIRPDLYRYSARTQRGPLLCKVHDARMMLPNGQPLFPPDATAAAIYVIRNPLDVCVSFAHHNGCTDYDAEVSEMASPFRALSPGEHYLSSQLRQRLLTWSEHVLSWVDARDLPVHVVRYEDMHASPIETFGTAAAVAGIATDQERVTRAVAFSSIDEMQRQERDQGFAESAAQRPFFRKGKIGSWRSVLSQAQAARLVEDHRDVMQRFGYLTEAGEPVY